MNDWEKLIDDYLDGETTPESEKRLSDWLAADPDNARIFVRKTHTHGLIRQLMAGKETAKIASLQIRAAEPKAAARRRGGWFRRLVLPLTAAAAAALIVAVAYFLNTGAPAGPQKELCAEVVAIGGQVELVRPGGTIAAAAGQIVLPGEGIKTGPDGSAKLRYPDGTTLEIRAATDFNIQKHEKAKRIFLTSGELLADVSAQPAVAPMILETPQAQAKIVGTRFTLRAEADKTRLEVEEGRVALTRTADGASVEVAGGFYAVAAAGVELAARPIKVQMPPADKVLFADSFDNSPLNEWPQGWAKHRTEAAARSGFRVLEAPGKPGERFIGCPNPPAGATQHAGVPLADCGRDFVFSFRLRLSGGDNDRAGVDFFDGRTNPAFEYDHKTSRLRAKDWLQGKTLKEIPFSLAPGAWSDWRISVEGGRASVRINDKIVLEVDCDLASVKEISLLSRGGHSAQFDDVQITRH